MEASEDGGGALAHAQIAAGGSCREALRRRRSQKDGDGGGR